MWHLSLKTYQSPILENYDTQVLLNYNIFTFLYCTHGKQTSLLLGWAIKELLKKPAIIAKLVLELFPYNWILSDNFFFNLKTSLLPIFFLFVTFSPLLYFIIFYSIKYLFIIILFYIFFILLFFFWWGGVTLTPHTNS